MYDNGFIHMRTVFPSDAVRKRTSLSLFFCIFLMEEAYSTSMSVLKLANSSLRFLRSKNTAQMEQAEYLNTCSWMNVTHLPFIEFNLYYMMQLLSQT